VDLSIVNMIPIVCAGILFVIFFLIAGLHFYWALGGQWAIEAVVPINSRGEKVLRTSVLSCIIVGCGLLMFAFYYVLELRQMDFVLTNFLVRFVKWIIPSIFLLRAIGDFNYVGFTKRITNSKFGRLDTKYFSPLCVLIAMLGFIVALA
jgi:hypothetical protein